MGGEITDFEITRAAACDIPQVRELFLEYARALGFDLCFQDFDGELAALPGKYAEPDGCLLVVKRGNETCGCVALRKLEDQICEMKRLYVKPGFRKHGLGKELVERIINEAKQRGYKFMRLDTLATMQSAIKLYKAYGFYEIPAYTFNPIPEAVYLELRLQDRG
jgi:ribosomal protein S18 acetylase RimI-like enzyme